jgi:hypothetical protein
VGPCRARIAQRAHGRCVLRRAYGPAEVMPPTAHSPDFVLSMAPAVAASTDITGGLPERLPSV